MENSSGTGTSKLLISGAIIVTFVYSGAIVILRWGSWYELSELKLNELGDFFAGVFGPIAFLWLVVGVMQQHFELRQNTRALEAQAIELHDSVKQHKQLVAATKDQVEAAKQAIVLEHRRSIREAQPHFRVLHTYRSTTNSNWAKFKLSLHNAGQTATDVRVEFQPALDQQATATLAVFEKGHTQDYRWKTDVVNPTPEAFKMRIRCTDRDGEIFEQEFQLRLHEGKSRYETVEVE